MFLTLLLPAVVLLGLGVLLRQRQRRMNPLPIAAFMVLGILSTGPLYMMKNATFSGGGFSTGGWRDVAVMTLMFPLVDLDFSTYDGTLFALAVSVLGLIVLSVRQTRATQPSRHRY